MSQGILSTIVGAISEVIDFRKLHGASEAVFRKFSATELYLKRARKTVAKDDEIGVDTGFKIINKNFITVSKSLAYNVR